MIKILIKFNFNNRCLWVRCEYVLRVVALTPHPLNLTLTLGLADENSAVLVINPGCFTRYLSKHHTKKLHMVEKLQFLSQHTLFKYVTFGDVEHFWRPGPTLHRDQRTSDRDDHTTAHLQW